MNDKFSIRSVKPSKYCNRNCIEFNTNYGIQTFGLQEKYRIKTYISLKGTCFINKVTGVCL